MKLRPMRGWGKDGKVAADPSVIIGGIKGSAARAQAHRKTKVPLTLAPGWKAGQQSKEQR